MRKVLILLLICVSTLGAQQERRERRRVRRRDDRREQRRTTPSQRFATQPWAGILDPSRATDWSQSGVEGGIPNYTTICSAAVTPSGDTTGQTDSAAINAALSTCNTAANSGTTPQVLLLPAGTFYSNQSISPPMGAKGLVIRGAGPDKTTIKWVGTSTACGRSPGVDLCFQGYTSGAMLGSVLWQGTNGVQNTYTQGATLLDVATPSATIAPGMLLSLGQRDDGVGLCLQVIATSGNCNGIVGLTNDGATPYATITAVTSIPYPEIVNGAKVWVGSASWSLANNTTQGTCGGYQTWGSIATGTGNGAAPVTVLTATTTATNTTFTYTATNPSPLTSPTAANSGCQPIFVSVDTGGLFTCAINAACASANAEYNTSCPNSIMAAIGACQGGEYSSWSQSELHVVKAWCTGAGQGTGDPAHVAQCLQANEVVLDTPVIAPNYRTARRPIAWWPALNTSTRPVADHIGVEAITLDASQDGNPFATLLFLNCSNFWVRNVRGLNTYSAMVWTANSVRGSIVDSYFYGTQHTGPNSYGIVFGSNASFILVQNNILQHMVSGLQVAQAYGNTRSYNYAFDNNYAAFNTMTSSQHGYAGANLEEGNNTNQCAGGAIHGTSYAITYFRNRCRGQDTPGFPPSNSNMSVLDQAFQRAWSFVGNVMGTVGYQQSYARNMQNCTPPTCLPPYPSEGTYWLDLGPYIEGGAFTGQFPIGPDPIVSQTILRWGNYDVATAYTSGNPGTAVPRWCATGSETGCSINTPAGISELPQAVPFLPVLSPPASHNLPVSFYLTGIPDWWVTSFGTPKWPAIGPDVVGGTAPDGTCNAAQAYVATPPCLDGGSGMADPIPAQLVSLNMCCDAAYQNANTITSVQSVPLTSGQNQWNQTATLSGTFTMGWMGVFKLSGMTPSGWNGIYEVNYSDGPMPADYSAPSLTFVATTGTGLQGNTYYRVAFTRVNQHGETKISNSTTPYTASGCPTTGNCAIRVNGPCSAANSCTYNAGYPTTGNPNYAGSYNVYMALYNRSLCKQNSTPIANNSTFTVDASTFIQPGTPASPNPNCISPPTVSTATGSTVNFNAFFAPTTNCVSPCSGTAAEPLIGTFNADHYYRTSALPPQVPTALLTASPTTIQSGQSATLSWNTSNATSASIVPTVGAVGASGSTPISPTTTTTYTLTATNSNGSQQSSATVTVTAPVPKTIQGLGQIQGTGVVK